MSLLAWSLLVASAVSTRASAQVIATLAGTDWHFPATPLPALSAPLGTTAGVAVDGSGNVYIADETNNLVERLSPDGTLSIVAGNGIPGFSGDGGPSTSASLSGPESVAISSAGDLYIVDSGNYRVRKVSGGTITTVAGNGLQDKVGEDGPATEVSLGVYGTAFLAGLTVDGQDNLYIADFWAGSIREVSAGIITTVAGTGECGPIQNGSPALQAATCTPAGVALDSSGNLYFTDNIASSIWKVSNGVISLVAGTGEYTFSGDGGPAVKAGINQPGGLTIDPEGNLYFADSGNNRIREISGGMISTVAGTIRGFAGDNGPAAAAVLLSPFDVKIDSTGDLYIADSGNSRVRKVSNGTIVTVAGDGFFQETGNGGFSTSATLGWPNDVALGPNGDVYIVDAHSNVVRKISNGIITTVAGNGTAAYYGDGGPATGASLSGPQGIAVDSAGDLYIADFGNNRVREVSDGIITTVAGNGSTDFSGDGGSALNASVWGPASVAVDSNGNLYIADRGHARIRMVSGGIINTVVGGGTSTGSGVDATSVSLLVPEGVAVDSSGNLYLSDNYSGLISKVSAGIITTVATASSPVGIAVDSTGQIYVTEIFDNRVFRASGRITHPVAGNGTQGFSGDGGLATAASLNWPSGVAVDAAGNVYIADSQNGRVRVVLKGNPSFADPAPAGPSPDTLVLAGSSGGKAVSTNLTVSAGMDVSSSMAVPGMTYSAQVSAGSSWLSVSPSSGATPGFLTVTADPTNLAQGQYTASIALSIPNANPSLRTIAVQFNVAPVVSASLAVDHHQLSFAYSAPSTARTQTITVSNSGSGSLPFNVSVVPNPGQSANWLSVSPATGTATAESAVTLTVRADPSNLAPGTYAGSISITSGAGSTSVAIVMTISSNPHILLLSQTGLTFTAVSQGGVVPPQTFAVRNIGTGVVPWTVSPSTLPAGLGWLQVTPAGGSSDAAQNPPVVTVSVNAAGLAAGIYYGLVQVNAPSAANSPQVVTVFLQVLAAGSDAAAVVDQGAMLFTAVTGGESPGSQTVSVYNITASARSFRSAVSADPGLNLVTLPTDATLDPQNPTPIVVQPFTNGLASGVYNATLTLQFSDGRVLRVNLKVIASNTGGGGPIPAAARRGTLSGPLDLSPCTPAKLLPALISLADSAELPTGLPVKLGVYVKDDCGNPVETGSVKATFSNGDTPATLVSLNGGLWEGQWLTENGALSQATVKLHAEAAGLIGDQQVTANLLALEQPPAFDQSGIVAAFGGAQYAAIAPGSVISIYGSQLASDAAATSGNPLPPQWLGTQVFISGGNDVLLPLPLYYVGPAQVNAVVPYEINVNTPLQLLVERGSTASQPVSLNLAAAAPALYDGPGAVTDYPPSGAAPYTVTASAPAHAGDYLVFYGLGLGAVNPSVADGGLPGGLSQVSGAQVQIGSQTVQPLFAGLTSQFPGLYQINVVVPSNTGTGSAVPVVVTIAGQSSQAILTAIQ